MNLTQKDFYILVTTRGCCRTKCGAPSCHITSLKFHRSSQIQTTAVLSFMQWLVGLGVWFSLRVREVPGSNPGRCNKSDLITCKWHSRQSVLKIRSENSSAGSAVWTRRNSRTDHGREGNTEWFPNLAPFHVFMCYTNLLFFLCQHKRMLDGEKWSLIIESKIFWQLCDKQNETEMQMRQWTQGSDHSPLWRTGSRLQSRAAGVAARGPHTAQTASPTCCTASQRQTALLHRDKQLVSGFFMLDSKRYFLLLSPHRAQLDSASEPCNK